MAFYHGRGLGKHLIDQGLCPPHARNVELHIPADGAVFIRYDVMFDTADVGKVARALQALADEPSAERPREGAEP